MKIGNNFFHCANVLLLHFLQNWIQNLKSLFIKTPFHLTQFSVLSLSESDRTEI